MPLIYPSHVSRYIIQQYKNHPYPSSPHLSPPTNIWELGTSLVLDSGASWKTHPAHPQSPWNYGNLGFCQFQTEEQNLEKRPPPPTKDMQIWVFAKEVRF